MNGFVIAAVLCAALMHAARNVLLKRHAATGVPTMAILAGSALAQTLYYRLLAAAYRDGVLSHAYPLMRGGVLAILFAAAMHLAWRLTQNFSSSVARRFGPALKRVSRSTSPRPSSA